METDHSMESIAAEQSPAADESIKRQDSDHPDRVSPEMAICDRCGRETSDIYMECQSCPDFVYCPSCFVDASLIHPGHGFKSSKAAEESCEIEKESRLNPPADNSRRRIRFKIDGMSTHVPTDRCQSCLYVTNSLPTLHQAIQDEHFRKEQALDEGRRIATLWHIRLSALVEATTQGCGFCSMFLEKFFGHKGNVQTSTHQPSRPWYIEPLAHESTQKKVIDRAMEVLEDLPNDQFVFKVQLECDDEASKTPSIDGLRIWYAGSDHDAQTIENTFIFRPNRELYLTVYAAEDNPAACDARTRPPRANLASTESSSVLESWLQECVANHGSSCSALESGQQAPLPHRLVDVTGGDSLRLYQTKKGESGEYCALSYSWWGGQTFLTTTETQKDRLSGFQIDCLPATIADAVRVTQKLGIKYIWVDALCILQDSAEDKAREIACMAEIYRYAHLTIVASTKGRSVHSGFLHNDADSDTGLWPNMVPLGYNMYSYKAAIPKHYAYGTLWLTEDDSTVLSMVPDATSTRGWCLQERILSPRTVRFGRWPTWKCNVSSLSDGGHFFEQTNFAVVHPDFQGLLLRLTKDTLPRADVFLMKKFLQAWYSLLHEYSKCELSIPSDRLPAIGGVASSISRATGMQYVAGLWAENFLHDLMWYYGAGEWMLRSKPWRAPTWSWASLEHGDWPRQTLITSGHIAEHATPLARVVDWKVEAGGSGPFGEIFSAELQIAGPMCKLPMGTLQELMKWQDQTPALPWSHDEKERDVQRHELLNRPRPWQDEGSIESLIPANVYALVTFSQRWAMDTLRNEKVRRTNYCGLLLQETEDHHYERIGMIKHEPEIDPAQGDWHYRTITIK